MYYTIINILTVFKIQLYQDVKAKNKNFDWEDVHVETQKLHANKERAFATKKVAIAFLYWFKDSIFQIEHRRLFHN